MQLVKSMGVVPMITEDQLYFMNIGRVNEFVVSNNLKKWIAYSKVWA